MCTVHWPRPLPFIIVATLPVEEIADIPVVAGYDGTAARTNHGVQQPRHHTPELHGHDTCRPTVPGVGALERRAATLPCPGETGAPVARSRGACGRRSACGGRDRTPVTSRVGARRTRGLTGRAEGGGLSGRC